MNNKWLLSIALMSVTLPAWATPGEMPLDRFKTGHYFLLESQQESCPVEILIKRSTNKISSTHKANLDSIQDSVFFITFTPNRAPKSFNHDWSFSDKPEDVPSNKSLTFTLNSARKVLSWNLPAAQKELIQTSSGRLVFEIMTLPPLRVLTCIYRHESSPSE